MKKNLKWEELLIIGGFNPTKLSETKFCFKGESKRNLNFLRSILNEGNISYNERFEEIEMLQNSLSFEQWIVLLKSVGQRSSGYSSKPDDLDLIAIDVSLLGTIRQLSKLGFDTKWSCDGHGKKTPFISFCQKEHTVQCKRLLSKLGYKVRFSSELYIKVLEQENELYQLGLDLSRLTNTDDLSIKKCINNRYEDVFEDLLMIPGVSGEEEYVREYLMDLLPGLLDEVIVDDYGNILGHKMLGEGPTVLLSAHMDVVDYIDTKSYILKNNNIWKRNTGILGADDRAGVALILNILSSVKKETFRGTIKVALTVEEEFGQNGALNIEPEFFNGIDFALSLDRRNGSDIVVKSTYLDYCTQKFGEIFERISERLGHCKDSFKTTQGGTSDLRVWSKLGVESVNLSIGYYNEHTENEFINLEEWHRTYELVMASLKKLQHIRRQV